MLFIYTLSLTNERNALIQSQYSKIQKLCYKTVNVKK